MQVIVTGGNSGVGKATASTLAAQRHSEVIACRDVEKSHRVAADMPGDIEVRHLDLGDLASVRAFADTVESVDVLVNNAGVMGMPLTRTADGFEAHIGINHLGHFALTCLLTNKIKDRVISVASAMYLFGRIDFDDLNYRNRKYSWWSGYPQSKLANLLFIHELAARGVRAFASDPGATDTDITRSMNIGERRRIRQLMQTPEQGARASIQAVTTGLPSGTYLAPRFNQFGPPKATKLRRKAVDAATARRLCDLSAELTGCDLPG